MIIIPPGGCTFGPRKPTKAGGRIIGSSEVEGDEEE